MKRSMMILAFLAVTAAIHTTGCSTTETTNPDGTSLKSVSYGSEFTLTATGTARLPDGARLRFDSVSNDSRCPVDVQCAWEGNAAVHLLFTGGSSSGGGELPFVLNTHRGYTTDTTFGTTRIQLTALDPEPRSDRQINPSDYIVHLEVTQR